MCKFTEYIALTFIRMELVHRQFHSNELCPIERARYDGRHNANHFNNRPETLEISLYTFLPAFFDLHHHVVDGEGHKGELQD